MAVYISAAYFVLCSSIIVICNLRKFRIWQRISLSLFAFFQVFGMILQMVFFPDTLLALFMSALGVMMILFTVETPDYQKLVITIDELSATKKVAEKAKEEAERAKEIAQQANRAEYSCAMKSHFRKSGNQMTGKWKSSYASLLA